MQNQVTPSARLILGTNNLGRGLDGDQIFQDNFEKWTLTKKVNQEILSQKRGITLQKLI